MKFKFQSKDEEKRLMTIKIKSLQGGLKKQRNNNDKLKEENEDLKKTIKKQEKEKLDIEQENDKLRRQCERYKNLLFKTNKKSSKEKIQTNQTNTKDKKAKKKKRGGQEGHKGKGKKNPKEIDITKRIFTSTCPNCSTNLKRTNSFKEHVVEDIPDFSTIKPDIVKYEMEVQWCPCCKKQINNKPSLVLPNSRYGINTIIYILLQKYEAKSSLSAITFNLKEFFGLTISKGGISGILRNVSKHLGDEYNTILDRIRISPVKFADETGHRTNGINGWAWGVFTEKEAYYTIEETRGKGIPEKIFQDVDKEDVLVRDDYGAYKKLPMKQQSCWAHLLRTAHETSEDAKASLEAKQLHKKLKNMFDELKTIVDSNFIENKRKILYQKYSNRINQIIESDYLYEDTKSIQTRIRNQNTNLITALIYRNVPLTNNLSERMLRPLVIFRKISGGSRSKEGAKTFAVNMSIFQTIKMNNKSLIPELRNYICK